MQDEEEIKDIVEAEELEEELEEVIRGRKVRCTCDTDPDFCEVHDTFA